MTSKFVLKSISSSILIMLFCAPCFSMESNNSEIKSFARGCWFKEIWDKTVRSWSSNLLCFKNDEKIILYSYFNRFGRDDILDWKFKGSKSISISDGASDSTCDVELINDDSSEIKTANTEEDGIENALY